MAESSFAMDQIVADPKQFYLDMIAMTSKCMNRLLHIPVHYECVRLKRHQGWATLMMAFATARSRLELVVSPDIYVYNALDKWKRLIDRIELWSDEEWNALFSRETQVMETIGIMFCPPVVNDRPDLRIVDVKPAALDPQRVYEELVSADKSSFDPTRLLKLLLLPDVRRLCMMQKNVQSHWASAIETVNWWRLCTTLSPSPQNPEEAKAEAMRRVKILSDTFVTFIETHSPFVDDTDDHDDYEVRCQTVKQNFELNMNAYHRSLESIADRRIKTIRHLEARERILE